MLYRLLKHPLKAKRVISPLFESLCAFCFLGLKFGLDFPLDPSEQGTRGSFFRSEMPFGELGVSPVALDAEWGPGPVSCGWLGWNPGLDFESKRTHNTCRRTVFEPWSRQGLDHI